MKLHILKSFKVNCSNTGFSSFSVFLLINDHSMTANKVEKYGFVVLNIKLQVKIKFKTFY